MSTKNNLIINYNYKIIPLIELAHTMEFYIESYHKKNHFFLSNQDNHLILGQTL